MSAETAQGFQDSLTPLTKNSKNTRLAQQLVCDPNTKEEKGIEVRQKNEKND